MYRMVKTSLCMAVVLLQCGTLMAQTTTGGNSTAGTAAQTSQSASTQTLPNHPLALPRGFESILLGLPVAEVEKLLTKSPYFAYRGEPDVSLSPVEKQPIIQTEGVRYIRSAIFQFHNNALYTITISLNRQLLDFYTMFTTLSEKYGNPTSLSPDEVVWENSQVRMSLEKPLTIKYIDRVVFDQIREAGKAQKSLQQLSLQDFIHLF